MGTTANLGIEIPDPSVTPSRENWIEKPIESVDEKVQAALVALSKRVKSGSVSGTIPTGQTYVDVSVAFTTPFSSTPDVAGALRSTTTAAYQAVIQSQSATGFTVRLMRPTGASTSSPAGLNYNWVASDLGNS